MKNVIYFICKTWIRIGLFLYFKKTKIFGTGHVPKFKPVLFVGNHQNALLDSLLVAVNCQRSPYFMSRSDIFTNVFIQYLLSAIRMIPVYRIRDGIRKITGNYAVFEKCATLLQKENAIVIFPEGNHSLKRKVRPLSKGFTRILFKALEHDPDLDIRLVPVGVNYMKAECFTDKVALYFGKDISVQEYYDASDIPTSIIQIKEVVYENLKKLTTHIENEEKHGDIVEHLDALKVDYLQPQKINEVLKGIDINALQDSKPPTSKVNVFMKVLDFIFLTLNFPMIILWRKGIKPKIKELEFRSTIRFLFSLFFFPIFYIVLYGTFGIVYNIVFAFYIAMAHGIFNLMYVKLK